MDEEKGIPRLRSKNISDVETMTNNILEILKMVWGKKWGNFYEIFPKNVKSDNITFPSITYSLDKIEPGEIGSNGRKDIKRKVREFIEFEEDGKSFRKKVSARIIDSYITFYCWDENNKKTNKLAYDFMKVIDDFTGYLKENGIQEIRFLEMSYGDTDIKEEFGSSRQVKYRFRYEEQDIVDTDVISKITTILRNDGKDKVIHTIELEKEQAE